jgi:hypothetical protein
LLRPRTIQNTRRRAHHVFHGQLNRPLGEVWRCKR